MKLFRLSLATLATLAVVSQAQAIELTVKGTITPPSCNVAMDGGGELIWDPIAHSELNATDFKVLSDKTARLVVTCDPGTKTSFAVKVDRTDNSQITGGGGMNGRGERVFGLGYDPVNTTTPLGNFVMLHKGGTYDSTAATAYGTGTREQTGTAYHRDEFTAGWAVDATKEEYTLVEGTGSQAASATVFNYEWTIRPALRKKAEITSTQVVPFQGKALLTVRYL